MKKLLALLAVTIFIFFAVRSWWNMQLVPVSAETAKKIFVVAKGQLVDKTAEDLKKEGLIRSPLIFKIYLKQNNLEDKIQAGTFKLSPSMSTEEIVSNLRLAAVDSWVTLLEGIRVEEMAEKISQELGVDKKEFLKVAKEGYMFPDTYLFSKDATVQTIAKVMQDNFNKKFDDNLKKKIKAQGLTEKEAIILASIVEREARSDEVRRMVASILLKRLKIDMGLNADATLQYALGYQKDEKSWWKRHLTNGDKSIESPFNTYKYRGLPPHPICNPSLSSIQAVVNADPSTPYLYYYHDSKGNSYYAENLEDHNKNVASNP